MKMYKDLNKACKYNVAMVVALSFIMASAGVALANLNGKLLPFVLSGILITRQVVGFIQPFLGRFSPIKMARVGLWISIIAKVIVLILITLGVNINIIMLTFFVSSISKEVLKKRWIIILKADIVGCMNRVDHTEFSVQTATLGRVAGVIGAIIAGWLGIYNQVYVLSIIAVALLALSSYELMNTNLIEE